MVKVDREALQKRIVNFYNSNIDKGKIYTVNHFFIEKVPSSTVYSILAKYERFGVVGDLPRSGRKPKMDKKKVKRLYEMYANQDGKSQRSSAKVFVVNQSTICRTLKRKCNLTYRKKEKAPYYEEKQLPKVIRASRKLAIDTFVSKEVIIDDEKYFTLGNTCIAGNNGYYTDNKSLCPDEVRYAMKKKYEKKLLVWIAISSKGISNPYIVESGNAIDATVYINKCLSSKLLKFIEKYHKNDEYIFWPDQASAHYGKLAIDWYNTHNIEFVPKYDNPPNVPKARPVEDFWGMVSQEVYKGGWHAQNLEQLEKRIRRKLKEFNVKNLQGMFEGIRSKLRKIADEGPYSIV